MKRLLFLFLFLPSLAFGQTTVVSGVPLPVSVANGGTGAATLTSHGVVIGAGTSGVSVTSPGTSGQVLTSNGASADPTFQAAGGGGGSTPTGTGYIHVTAGTQDGAAKTPYATFIFSDGSDGALTFDGSTTPIAGATLSGSTYTLSRDIYATTIAVNAGVTVFTNNYRCYANVSITVNSTGVIECNGNNAVANNAGAQVAQGTIPTFQPAGGAGQTTTATGGNGGSSGSYVYGGAAGVGGSDGAGHNGGTVTSPSPPTATRGSLHEFPNCITGFNSISGGFGGGEGGSGGGNTTGSISGGGGGGGGALIIASPSITNNGTISCNGGTGGNASGGAAGGGGGGGGGWLVTIGTFTGNTPTVAGGTHGTGAGTGTNGGDGSSGTLFQFVL